jgi:hypothetical protein
MLCDSATCVDSEVLEILAWHPDDDKIYYTATMPDLPGAQHLFRVPADGKGQPECMSCKHPEIKEHK